RARGPGALMPSYTISGSDGGDSLHCLGTVFADVCAGSGAGVTGFDTATANSQDNRFPGVGNDTDGQVAGCDPAEFNVGLWFIPFDTSGIPSGEIVTSVTFRAFASNRLFGASNWQYELYAVDFGATIGAE